MIRSWHCELATKAAVSFLVALLGTPRVLVFKSVLSATSRANNSPVRATHMAAPVKVVDQEFGAAQ